MVPLALWVLAAAGTAWLAHVWYLPLTAAQAFTMAFYAAVGVAGAALAGSALARHQAGGVLAASLWWGLDLQNPGEVNTLVYLFSTFRPVAGLDPANMCRRLLLVGLAGLAEALWQAGRRERWVTGAPARQAGVWGRLPYLMIGSWRSEESRLARVCLAQLRSAHNLASYMTPPRKGDRP